ncbi:MAG TPA: hypothetical protein VK304_11295 [Thermoleophilaceae bacterium]|nr:hypothetical protein [Thermoleophilaceae bacterium]
MLAGRPPLRLLIAVGLIAGSTLALQVLLTRVFAAVLFYHFGFLAISLALLGVGGGAILIYVRPAWFERVPLQQAMARAALAYGGLLLVLMAATARLNFRFEGVTLGFIFTLAVPSVLAGAAFLAAGIAIALAVRAYVQSIGRVYAYDLAGAGIGALAVVPPMWLLDAPRLVVLLAVLVGAAAALVAGPSLREARLGAGLAVVAVALAVVPGVEEVFQLRPDGREPDVERWTPLSRVQGFVPRPNERRPQSNGIVVYDRVLGEIIPARRDRIPDWRRLQEGPQSIGYQLTGPGDALVIGGGGGRDILNALSEKQRRVDVIELNRGIRKVVDDDLRWFSGGPYALPRVHTRIGDGRSRLSESGRLYDQVHIGFTDTFSPSSAQAFALTENNLYTIEAFDEYFDHLKPDGVLNVSRPQRHLGDEAIRVTVLTLDALRRRGIKDPERHVVVLRGYYKGPFRAIPYGTVLAKLKPFTAAEHSRIRRLAADRGGGLAFAPGGPYREEWRGLASAPSLDAFCGGYEVNVCPPTDDKPFFFHMKRLGDLGSEATSSELGVPDPMLILLITLGILLVLASFLFALPLAMVPARTRPDVGSLLFFVAIGLGFLVLEVVLIQRFVLFLGFPTYALSVVLFTLLVSTGAGAWLSGRGGSPDRTRLIGALAFGCMAIAASIWGLRPLLDALIDIPFALRILCTVVLLAPVGAALGFAMPIGLRRLQGLYPEGVAWAWGVNGVASVVGSVLAIAVAINLGYPWAAGLAVLCYAGALAHAVLGRWVPPEESPRPDSAGGERVDAPLSAVVESRAQPG